MAKMVKIKKIGAANKLKNNKKSSIVLKEKLNIKSKVKKTPVVKKQQEPQVNVVEYESYDDDDGEMATSSEEEEVVKPTTQMETSKCKVVAKKPRLEGKVKAPTLEEINNLKETQNLYHSNLFRLQVQQMLEEIKVKEKHVSLINSWLEKFNSFMRGLAPETEKQAINELPWLQKCGVTLPFQLQQFQVQNKQNKNVQFQYIKPKTDCALIGAAATKTLLGPALVADVCIAMPAECFQKNNNVNYIYEHKRALYLTYITWKLLQDSKTFKELGLEQLKFNYFGNNALKPVLEINPEPNADKLKIRLFVVAEESAFKLSRFVPWNNNMRETMFIQDAAAAANDETDVTQWATPNYNANILFDLTMQANQALLREVFDGQSNLQQGLLLLKVWLRQRFLHIGYTGFSAHILAMYIVYLRQQKKLHATMSSYQVARIVWNQLGKLKVVDK